MNVRLPMYTYETITGSSTAHEEYYLASQYRQQVYKYVVALSE